MAEGMGCGTLGDTCPADGLLHEHVAVEKQKCAEGRVPGGCCHAALDRQPAQEGRELGRAHIGGVALTVEGAAPASRTHAGGAGAVPRAGARYETGEPIGRPLGRLDHGETRLSRFETVLTLSSSQSGP